MIKLFYSSFLSKKNEDDKRLRNRKNKYFRQRGSRAFGWCKAGLLDSSLFLLFSLSTVRRAEKTPLGSIAVREFRPVICNCRPAHYNSPFLVPTTPFVGIPTSFPPFYHHSPFLLSPLSLSLSSSTSILPPERLQTSQTLKLRLCCAFLLLLFLFKILMTKKINKKKKNPKAHKSIYFLITNQLIFLFKKEH